MSKMTLTGNVAKDIKRCLIAQEKAAEKGDWERVAQLVAARKCLEPYVGK